MWVFIENEAGSAIKNLFNEKTHEYRKSVPVSAAYPFPYGFLVQTKSGDGDCLDCFVLTARIVKTGSIVDVEPVGMFEQTEDGKEDQKILAVLPGEKVEVTQEVQSALAQFVLSVFRHLPGKRMEVGRFLGKQAAMQLIKKTQRGIDF